MSIADATNANRAPAGLPTYQDLLKGNAVGEIIATLREQSPRDYGSDGVPSVERFTSAAYHRREVAELWPRVWQFACLTDDVPNVGDYTTYEIAGRSIIITRSGEQEISAFYNACLHKAAALADGPGSTTQFICPYHGWRYDLDGTLAGLPTAWDFPKTCIGTDRITQVKAEAFYGMIWINMDLASSSLAEYLKPLDRFLDAWPPMDKRVRTAWVRKVVPVNWKAAQEAFMEGYHLPISHPEVADLTQGYEAQYDVIGEHVGRTIAGNLGQNAISGPASEQEMMDRFTASQGMPSVPVPEGQTARSILAMFMREQQREEIGLDLSETSDPEVIDSALHYVFPNTVIWGSYLIPWIYRFRPNGNDPTSSIMEVIQLNIVPEGTERTHAPIHDLGEDEKFSDAPELGFLGPVLDQDYVNQHRQSIGLRSTPNTELRYSRYQESLLRHHHHVLDEYLTNTPPS